MSEKFRGKYRVKSSRCPNWDYRSNASYFITICTQNREHFFGEIINKKMILSEIGKIAENFWFEITNHFPFVKLDEFVVMPNHIHGIIIIDNDSVIVVETLHCNVSTTNPTNPTNPTNLPSDKSINDFDTTPIKIDKNEFMAKISPKSGSLSSILRSYKFAVKRDAKIILNDFDWQARFHDHIIRDNKSFKRIQNYILNNPKNWNGDKFYN